MITKDRLFVGVYPTGIVYADRSREVNGDYARCAFLPFVSLELEVSAQCPPELLGEIRAEAQTIIDRRGQQFEISASGQTIRLGPPLQAAAAAEREAIEGDKITFHEAYNILLEGVHESSSAVHRDHEGDLSRSNTRFLADREIRLHESCLALLDALLPGCSDRIYTIDDFDQIEFMTDTIVDLTTHLKADLKAGRMESFAAVIEANITTASGKT